MQPGDADIATIEMLYRRHSPALLLFALAMTRERSRAQDAVHQVFLKLLERGSAARAVDVKAYLFASVRNAILNDAKVRKREVPIDSESAWFDPPNRDHAAELNLRRALGALSDDQREVTIMHIWGDLTFSEIAEVLGVSPNTAASRYRYALAKLRDAMCVREEPYATS
jgi:RNA polymerase sigma-70 factor (ECF subfamily)